MARPPTLFPRPANFKAARSGGPRAGVLKSNANPVQLRMSTIVVPIDAEELSDRVIKGAMKKGVTKACFALMDHAMNEAPKVPKRGGTLRESGAIFINNKLIHENPKEGGRWQSAAGFVPGETPLATGGDSPFKREGGIKKRRVSGMVAFLMWYAALVHEGIAGWHEAKNYTLSGSGRKFLESKIHRHKNEYAELINDEVRDSLAKSLRRMKSRAGISR